MITAEVLMFLFCLVTIAVGLILAVALLSVLDRLNDTVDDLEDARDERDKARANYAEATAQLSITEQQFFDAKRNERDAYAKATEWQRKAHLATNLLAELRNEPAPFPDLSDFLAPSSFEMPTDDRWLTEVELYANPPLTSEDEY